MQAKRARYAPIQAEASLGCAVGQNHQDHVAFGCTWGYFKPQEIGSGGCEATLYWKSDASTTDPDGRARFLLCTAPLMCLFAALLRSRKLFRPTSKAYPVMARHAWR